MQPLIRMYATATCPYCIRAEQLLLDKGVLRAHQKVTTAHGAGEITSGTFSPTLQLSVALARLPMGVSLGDTVEVDGGHTADPVASKAL